MLFPLPSDSNLLELLPMRRREVHMPRSEAEYAALRAEFEAKRGPAPVRCTKSRVPKPPKPSAEAMFAAAWTASGGVPFEPQYRFDAERKWTIDFAWPRVKLALEIEGAVGRHHMYSGIVKDAEKFAELAIRGWRVIRVPALGGRDVAKWVELVQRALEAST
jgi:hypothetical protein